MKQHKPTKRQPRRMTVAEREQQRKERANKIDNLLFTVAFFMFVFFGLECASIYGI